MRALVMRLDAPMMSFGTVIVDQHGYIDRFPGTAMLCGLIANALGWHHSDFERLQQLQERIAFAARWDVQPRRMIDYHTVDLGQVKMREPGWTTRGEPEHRGGGTAAKLGIHQRYRHYWTDGLMSVVFTLAGDMAPDLNTVAKAMRYPARPLFIGRKNCLPARPLLDPVTPIVEGEDLYTILRQVPVWNRDATLAPPGLKREACWSAEIGTPQRSEMRIVYDLRDWANQIPAGSRTRAEGLIGEDR
jgi:CRISPR system Cascade subunit CasD